MSLAYRLTPSALEDLDEILIFIAADKPKAADRFEFELIRTFQRLAKSPLIGIRRKDITALPVRFLTVGKFPNYVVVYRPETKPLQLIAVTCGRRDLSKLLEHRI